MSLQAISKLLNENAKINDLTKNLFQDIFKKTYSTLFFPQHYLEFAQII